jgi:hypothetical protein
MTTSKPSVRPILGSVLAASIVLLGSPAAATTLYSQAPAYQAFLASQTNLVHTFDEFTLDAPGTVTRVDWWGEVENANTPNPLSFTIEFYETAYYTPASYAFPYANLELAPIATTTGLAQWETAGETTGSHIPVRHYWMDLPNVALPGDELLWIGIRLNNELPIPWYWLRSADKPGEAVPTFNQYFPDQEVIEIATNDTQGGNLAFTLTGGAVPEPGTWLLMLAGFGLAGAALRVRRLGNVVRL